MIGSILDNENEELRCIGLTRGPDGLLRWRNDSPDHPRNWSTRRKVYDTTVITFLEFYVTVISTTGAIVADDAGPELGMGKIATLLSFTFMYNLGQAFGGCLIPPLSELVGRRTPYLVSCILFSLFNLIIGTVPHQSAIWAGRFITGFTSAIPAVVTAGSVEDMFSTERRVAAVVTAAMFVLLLGIRESRPSKLLKRKIAALESQGNIENLDWFNPDHSPDWRTFMNLIAVRPMRLLATEPLMIMATTIFAISWGIIYLFTESLLGIYQSLGFTRPRASLPFLVIASGIALTALPRLWDMKIIKRRRKQNERVEPEDKITGFALAAPALASGLVVFSWTIPPLVTGVHWIVPTLALAPIGFAVNEMAYTLSGYLADAYLLYASSAFSAIAFVRALVSGLMPLIAHIMYAGLGANLAGTVIAGIAVVFRAAPWVFFRYSKKLREASPFARFSLEGYRRTNIEGL
ncbi:major facilitator superfamily transporter [Xylariomycetidae sp. FL2044]|nr:major facilitator superfamily transporter [Xylariomycetidae sp. FL2044]